MIDVVDHPIDTAQVLASVSHPGAGGIALFVGTTRNHSHGKEVLYLEYEAYVPMALSMMTQIAAEATARWGLHAISIVHRRTRVGIGEASVVIAVSSSHRKEAFEACRYAIDTLKKTVPVWKKEFFADGAVWVDGEDRNSGEPEA
jgi:molybdopterin synthase catalytic subunit